MTEYCCSKKDILAHDPELRKDVDAAFEMFKKQLLENPIGYSSDSDSDCEDTQRGQARMNSPNSLH